MSGEEILQWGANWMQAATERANAEYDAESMHTEADDDEELTFRDKVFEAVRNNCQRETRTYKEIAAATGNAKASRAAAAVLAKNPFHFEACHNELGQCTDWRYVPCHNVVRSDFDPTKPGAFDHLPYLGEHTAEASAKRKKLMTEGK